MSEETETRPYRGVPLTERRSERRDRLMSAVIAVVAREGWAGATVRRVAAEAGVGGRFVYESFADIDALAAAAYDRLGAELIGRAVAAVEESELEPAQAAIPAILKVLAADPAQARFLLCEAPVLAERRTAMVRSAAGEFAVHAAAAGSPRTREQLVAGAVLVAGGGLELIRGWLDGTLDLDLDGVAALLVEALTVTAGPQHDLTVPRAPR